MNTPPAEIDWRLWVLAAVAAINLVLGLWNAAQTARLKKLEGRLRKFSIRLDEFRTQVRDPIRTSTSDIGPLVRRLEAIAKTRSSIDDHIGELRDANAEVMSLLGATSDALDTANRSSFASGQEWLDLVVPIEDVIATQFNTARDVGQPQVERLAAVQVVADQLVSLRTAIDRRLDKALSQFEQESEAPS